jgi:hypothetical protein
MPITNYLPSSRLIQPGVCTSTTRPASPFEGQAIYETDTDMMAIWNGSAWRYIAATTPTNGSILQVASATITSATSTTSSSFGDISGLSVSITPKSTSSKVFISVTMMVSGNSTDDCFFNIVRNSTAIGQGTGASNNQSLYLRLTDSLVPESVSIDFLDSPSTTSATTYKMQWRTRVGTLFLNNRAFETSGFVNSGISTITVMEIAG